MCGFLKPGSFAFYVDLERGSLMAAVLVHALDVPRRLADKTEEQGLPEDFVYDFFFWVSIACSVMLVHGVVKRKINFMLPFVFFNWVVLAAGVILAVFNVVTAVMLMVGQKHVTVNFDIDWSFLLSLLALIHSVLVVQEHYFDVKKEVEGGGDSGASRA